MANIKENDWVLITAQNPELTLLDISNDGYSVDNTSLRSKEDYKNSNYIRNMELFQTNGKFDETKFNRFYDDAVVTYNALANDNYIKLTDYERASFNYNNMFAPKEKRNKDISFNIVNIPNPDRRNIGTEVFGYISDPQYTPLEIAQTQKIHDSGTGELLDSPNDSWLWRDWTNPVALAQYDEDLDINGNPTSDPDKIYHHKGEFKIDPDTGTYYYETLNGKTPYGRTLLSPWDILTKDGSVANQYDFMDSDGMSKSLTGSIAKTITRVAPLFIPYVGEVYAATLLAVDLAEVLPVIYKSTFGLLTDENSADKKFMNRIEGIASSLGASKLSQEGQQSFFNSENIANLVADVVELLYTQRWVFTKAPKVFKKYGIDKPYKADENGLKLSGLEKEIERKTKKFYDQSLKDLAEGKITTSKDILTLHAEAAAKATLWGEKYQKGFMDIGRHISRTYMTGITAVLAFQDAKEEGASDLEAAALFWGYFAGEYALLSTEIGEHILPELRMERQEIRKLLVGENGVATALNSGVKTVTDLVSREGRKNIFINFFNKGTDLAKKVISKGTHPITQGGNSILSNALAEGFEETTEELLYDITKTTFNILLDFSGREFTMPTFDNVLERYGGSFFGGALGGAMFLAGADFKSVRLMYSDAPELSRQKLLYYIRNDKEALKKELDKLHKRGELGNTKLSATMETVENGEIVYKEGTKEDNQNETTYRVLNQFIDNIDNILTHENMNLKDADVIDGYRITNADVLSQVRYQLMFNDLDEMAGLQFTGTMLQDWQNMADQFVKLHTEIDKLGNYSDEQKRNDPMYLDRLEDLQRQLKELRDQRKNFFDLKNQEKYTEVTMLANTPLILGVFGTHLTYRAFAEQMYNGKSFEELNEYQKELAKLKYIEFLGNGEAKKKILSAFNVFDRVNNALSAKLAQIGDTKYVKYGEALKKLFDFKVNAVDENRNIAIDEKTGEPLTMTFLDAVLAIFSTLGMSTEDFVKKAQALQSLWNPFTGFSQILFEENKYQLNQNMTPAEAVKVLKAFDEAIDQLSTGGYLDLDAALFLMKVIDRIPYISNIAFYETFDYIDLTYSRELAGFLSKQINTMVDNMNPSNKEEVYNKFVENILKYIAENEISEDVNEVLTEVLTILNDTSFLTPEQAQARAELENLALSIMQKLKTRETTNPILSFLKEMKVTTTRGGRTVFDILLEAEKLFKEKNVNEFALEGTLTVEEVEEALTTLQILNAVVYASLTDNLNEDSAYGINWTLNRLFREGSEGKSKTKLGTVDTATSLLMLKDIALLKSKLEFILKLNELNNATVTTDQDRVAVNYNFLTYDLFVNQERGLFKTLTAEGDDKEFVDKKIREDVFYAGALKEAVENARTLNKYYKNKVEYEVLTEEEKVQMEKERVAIEDAFYDRFQELAQKYSTEEVIKTLFFTNMIDTKALSNDGVGIDPRTVELSESDKLSYLASIVAVKSSDFMYLLRQVETNDNSKIVPIPSQEIATRLTFANFINKGLITDILEQTHVEKNGITAIINAVFVPGIPGAGKTRGVARVAYKMAKLVNPDLKVLAVGPKTELAKRLSLSLDNALYLNKELLFNDKLGTNLEAVNDSQNVEFSEYEGIVFGPSGSIISYIKPGVVDIKNSLINNFSKEEVPNLIVIDEVTNFTNAELLVISEYCNENKVPLVLLGDTDQSGVRKTWEVEAEGKNENGNDTTSKISLMNSFNTTFCLTAPKLRISMRSSNTNNRDNINMTRAALEAYTITKLLDPTTTGAGTSIENINNMWGKLASLFLFKYTNINGRLLGALMQEESEVTLETLNQLLDSLKEGEKLGYIYDSLDSKVRKLIDLLSDERKLKIEIYTEADAAGAEATYYIVDIDWAKKKILPQEPGAAATELVNFVHDLYTTLSRSSEGTLLINRGLTQILKPESFIEVAQEDVQSTSNNDETLLNYKEKRLAIYDTILGDYKPLNIEIIEETDEDEDEDEEDTHDNSKKRKKDKPEPKKKSRPNKSLIIPISDLNKNSIDFNNNIVFVGRIGEETLDKIINNNGQMYVDNNTKKVKNWTELKRFVQSSNAKVGIIVIPNSKIKANEYGDITKFLRRTTRAKNGNFVPKTYLKYIVSKNAKPATNKKLQWEFSKNRWIKYKNKYYKITDRLDDGGDGKPAYLLQDENRNTITVSKKNIEKPGDTIYERPLTIPETKATPNTKTNGAELSSKNDMSLSLITFENLKKRSLNPEDIGIFLFPKMGGQRTGLDLERNSNTFEVLVNEDGKVHINKVIYDGDSSQNLMLRDIQAILGLTPEDIPQGGLNLDQLVYFEAVKTVNNIKSLILNFTGDPENLHNEVKNIIINFLKDRRVKRYIGKAAFKNTSDTVSEYAIKVSNRKFDPTDLSTYGDPSEVPGAIPSNENYHMNKLLVYKIGNYEFTLAGLQSPLTHAKFIEQFKTKLGNDPNALSIIDSWESISEVLDKINELHAYNKNIVKSTHYFGLGANLTLGNNRISNSRKRTLTINNKLPWIDPNSPLKVIDFAEFKKDSRMVCSDPHIMTSVDAFRIFGEKAKDLVGRAVAFVTHDKSLTYNGQSVVQNPNLLMDMWSETHIGKKPDLENDNIKIVLLDTKGVSFSTFLLSVVDSRNAIMGKTDRAIFPIGNMNTPGRLMQFLLTLSADLRLFALDIYNLNEEATREIIDRILPETIADLLPHDFYFKDNHTATTNLEKLDYLKRKINLLNAFLGTTISAISQESGKKKTKAGTITDKNAASYGIKLNDFTETNIALTREAWNKLANSEDSPLEALSGWKRKLQQDGTFAPGVFEEYMFGNSLKFLDIFARYFTNWATAGEDPWKISAGDDVTETIDLIDKAVKYYLPLNDPNNLGITNFKNGIYFVPSFLKSNRSTGARTAELAFYPADNIASAFTIDVDIQAPDYILAGEPLQILRQHLGLNRTVERSQRNFDLTLPAIKKSLNDWIREMLQSLTPPLILNYIDVDQFISGLATEIYKLYLNYNTNQEQLNQLVSETLLNSFIDTQNSLVNQTIDLGGLKIAVMLPSLLMLPIKERELTELVPYKVVDDGLYLISNEYMDFDQLKPIITQITGANYDYPKNMVSKIVITKNGDLEVYSWGDLGQTTVEHLNKILPDRADEQSIQKKKLEIFDALSPLSLTKQKADELTPEMQDILANAPRDAEGRLLAPNGKPTKLNERQYAHVRTKAFKEWFGDWERERIYTDKLYSNKLPDLSIEEIKNLTEKFNNKEEIVVYAATNAIKKIKQEGIKFTDSGASYEGKELNVFYASLNPSYAQGYAEEYYTDGTDISNIGIIKIKIKNNSGKSVIEGQEVRIRDLSDIIDYEEVNLDKNPHKELIYDKKPDNVSKVIDDKGEDATFEPLVVYHGGNRNIKVFNTTRNLSIGKYYGSYFTKNKDFAKIYENLSENGIIYEAFLNIKNPAEIEDTRLIDEDTYKSVIDNNYDGAIGKTIEEYVIFNPNQIKSATDNVGTYSRDDNDINGRAFKLENRLGNEALAKAIETTINTRPSALLLLLLVYTSGPSENKVLKDMLDKVTQLVEEYKQLNGDDCNITVNGLILEFIEGQLH